MRKNRTYLWREREEKDYYKSDYWKPLGNGNKKNIITFKNMKGEEFVDDTGWNESRRK